MLPQLEKFKPLPKKTISSISFKSDKNQLHLIPALTLTKITTETSSSKFWTSGVMEDSDLNNSFNSWNTDGFFHNMTPIKMAYSTNLRFKMGLNNLNLSFLWSKLSSSNWINCLTSFPSKITEFKLTLNNFTIGSFMMDSSKNSNLKDKGSYWLKLSSKKVS